jgi:hypothetical protein
MSSDPGAPGGPDDEPPRPLLGLGFWLFLILCLACVLAGVAVATLGPRLFAHA